GQGCRHRIEGGGHVWSLLLSAGSGSEARAGSGQARPGSRSGSEARAGSGAARIGSGDGGGGGGGGRGRAPGRGRLGGRGGGRREGVARGVAGEELPVEGVQLTGTVAAVAGPAHHHLGDADEDVLDAVVADGAVVLRFGGDVADRDDLEVVGLAQTEPLGGGL